MRDGWFGVAPICSSDYLQYKGPYPYGNHGPRELHQPPVVAAVAIAFAGGMGPATLGQLLVAKLLVGAATSIALGVLSSALAPKPETPDLSSFSSIKSSGLTRQIRQAVTERRVVYGETRVSGPIMFISTTGDNKYLHMIIALGDHEFEDIGEVFANDLSIAPDQMDVDGLVTSGRYSGLIRIKKHLGDVDQFADGDLVSEVTEWTSDHRLRGVTYLYARIKFDRDAFPTGIPNFSAWVKGKKVLDPRDAVERWTPCIPLFCRDYLTWERYGLDAKEERIDDVALMASANTSDEMVNVSDLSVNIIDVDESGDLIELDGEIIQFQTGDMVNLVGTSLPEGLSELTDYYIIVYQRRETPRIRLADTLADAIGGTAVDITSDGTGSIIKKAEPRYHGGGVVKSSAERGANLDEMTNGMAGYVIYSGGAWRILAGEYQTPTISFDENDVIGRINIQTKVSKRDRFNIIQGVYVSPLNEGNPSDYPAVKNASYQAQDGSKIKKDINQAYVQRPHHAQRVGKVYLERSRQEIVFNAPFKLTAFNTQVADNFFFNFAKYGWENKIFEVIDWDIASIAGGDGVEVPVINITARENAPEVYDWNSGEETRVDPAPNTNLPNAFNVTVVGGFSLDSIPVFTQDQDRIYNILASWETHENQFVASGGKFEIEYKTAEEIVYKSAGIVDGSISEMRITALQPDTLYDIRIYAFNNLGVRSQPSLIEGFLVGTTVTTDTEDWESEDLLPEDWENDTLPSEDWEA